MKNCCECTHVDGEGGSLYTNMEVGLVEVGVRLAVNLPLLVGRVLLLLGKNDYLLKQKDVSVVITGEKVSGVLCTLPHLERVLHTQYIHTCTYMYTYTHSTVVKKIHTLSLC